jgi:hypothetical protein
MPISVYTAKIILFVSISSPPFLDEFVMVCASIALFGTFANIIFSTVPVMSFGSPAIIFELIIDLWLWVKGINVVREK